MTGMMNVDFKGELLERRRRLLTAMSVAEEAPRLDSLLRQVDAALERLGAGSFGLCLECSEEIEQDRLIADPTMQFCLDHLPPAQRDALQRDLDLASRVQGALLPRSDLVIPGWDFAIHYQAAGPVSGDYCDIVLPQNNADGGAYFIVGDVSGKGVAASMLMAHLHAMFRTLASMSMPLKEVLRSANRIFCESTMTGQYATIVCGWAGASGEVSVCNAGHLPPLMMSNGAVTEVGAGGLPIGIFCETSYVERTIQLADGDSLFLYTDGMTEARNEADIEYGRARLAGLLADAHRASPRQLIDRCSTDLKTFRGSRPPSDDLTLLVLRRGGERLENRE